MTDPTPHDSGQLSGSYPTAGSSVSSVDQSLGSSPGFPLSSVDFTLVSISTFLLSPTDLDQIGQ